MSQDGARPEVGEPAVLTARRPGLRTAATVLTVAGLVWWLAGASAGLPLLQALPSLLAGAAAAVVLLVLVRRLLDSVGEQELFERHRRLYTMVNVAQGVAVALVVVLGVLSGQPAWIAPGLAFVVALHFLPLGTAFGWAGYTRLALAMALVAAAGAGLASTGTDPQTVQRLVMCAVALAFWVTVVGALLTRPGPRTGVGARRRGNLSG